MEKVTISAHIREKRKTEFLVTMESLKKLIEKSCRDFEFNINHDDKLVIQILFEDKDKLESNFYNEEFNILKGSVRSVCDDVSIKIN